VDIRVATGLPRSRSRLRPEDRFLADLADDACAWSGLPIRQALIEHSGQPPRRCGHALRERQGGKVGRGSENKAPFIAAIQTTEDGQPVLACFAVQPFTTEAVSVSLAKVG